MRTYNEVNNMSWRVRPDDILLEVGRLFGSKMGLQKLNFEVWLLLNIIEFFVLFCLSNFILFFSSIILTVKLFW